MRIGWCPDGHGDDQDLLTLESLDKGVLVVIVDSCRHDAFRKLAAVVGARDGCHGVFASLDESLGEPRSQLSTGLRKKECPMSVTASICD